MASQAVIPGGGVTGSGELPGRSADEALRMIAGELGSPPHLPYLPLLPERGPGADPVGRTAGMLTGVSAHFALATTPSGWRIDGGSTSAVMRRSRSWLVEDLDAAEEHLSGFDRALLLPLVGPWSMAASVELVTGHRLVSDHGAVADLVAAMAETAASLVAEARRRLPGCTPVLRLDEPRLDSVLTGGVGTPSGLDRYRSVQPVRAIDALRAVVDSAAAAGAECVVRVAGGPLPLAVMAPSGAHGLAVDISSISMARDAEQLGGFVDEGGWLVLGVDAADVRATVDSVTRLWSSLGFAAEDLPGSVAIQPAAQAVPATDPVAQFEALRQASARLRDVSPGHEDGLRG